MAKSIEALLKSIERKAAGVEAPVTANRAFGKWLDTFLTEKGIDREETLEVEGKMYGTNWMPISVLVAAIKVAPKHEQDAIKSMLVKIDFKNGNVRHYLTHLAKAIAL